MKAVVLLVAALAVTSAEWIEIDWSQVRPIEEFDHYWTRLPAELQFLRASFPHRRIANGHEAIPGQFPYQIALLSDFQLGQGLCGGSVLTNSFILTAAHCVQNALGGVAIMGVHNRVNYEPSQQRINFSPAGIFVHSGYTPTNFRNDIATVRLNSQIFFTDRVQPVRIPTYSDGRTFAGMMGTVSGFGRLSDASTSTAAVVVFTSNPIMSNADCLAHWGHNYNIIEQQNICMSGDGGRSACTGDNGGPLTISERGQTLQVGIMSFESSRGCTVGIPSVYVRVSHYLSWIAQHSDYIV